jgi:ribosomal-protein-alanine N-acetyltransferase
MRETRTPRPTQSFGAVRPANVSDLDDLLRLQASAPEAAQWSRESLRQICAHSSESLLCATSEKESLIGFILFRTVAGELEILNLVVDPAFRRRGVGMRLLGFVLRQAQAQGIRRIFLEVRQSNFAAQALYAANGFHVTGQRAHYYAQPVEDAVVLGRIVRSAAEPTE